jgi:hypothetical protein
MTNEMINEIMTNDLATNDLATDNLATNDLATDNLATDANEIPFIIFEANCIRPSCTENTFGTCDISEIPSYFINKFATFILCQLDTEPINDITDIERFWNRFYADRGNSPWHASIFINNKWTNATPSNEEVIQRIRQIQLQSHY